MKYVVHIQVIDTIHVTVEADSTEEAISKVDLENLDGDLHAGEPEIIDAYLEGIAS